MKKRRRNNKNKLVYAMLLTACLCMAAFAMVKGSAISASAQSNRTTAKYYKSILVEHGDNLWTIADAQMSAGYSDKRDYIAEVKSINHISDDTIHSGEYICVPYYK